jgi:LacI family transcriptional regulator, repressor for deo operon, udp, cdd, tsx, nupC, and nupG
VVPPPPTPIVQENEYIDVLLDRDVAALILLAGRHANTEVDHRRYHELRAAGVPLMMLNGHLPGLDAGFVASDEAQAFEVAVRHLRDLGHERIGCAMGPPRYVSSQRKVAGFLQALGAVGPRAATTAEAVAHSVYSVEGGLAAAEALLARGMTAIVCGNDLMALGAVRAVRARGLQVPDSVSVVGYDDSALIAFTDPPLTTMRQNVAAMCRHAVEALVDELGGAPHPRQEVLFPAELMVRRSTAPPPQRP